MNDILELSPVMPVVVIDDASRAVDLAHALLRGGVRVIEITLRTPAALAAITAVARDVPDMRVGAGTVANVDDLARARQAGASFAISPGLYAPLLEAASRTDMPYLPGVATASELMTGLDAGYRHFKFFPAETTGGVAAIRALSAPFAQARFCPTGGITLDSAASYLEIPSVLCVGGSWLTPGSAIAQGEWKRIEDHARAAVSRLARTAQPQRSSSDRASAPASPRTR